MRTFGQRLREAREEAGLTQAQLAKQTGLAQATISNTESGRNQGSSEAVALARALGVSPDWLAEGRGQKRKDEPEIIDLETHPDLVPVKRYSVRPSCSIDGVSIDLYEDENELPIFFRRDWLKSNGYKVENLAALKVKGRSMEPSLWEGDLVVINRAETEPKNNVAFAVNHEGECVIKRLRRSAEGRWNLESDNLDKVHYPAEPCTEGTLIIGRVVYRQTEII
ncbi:MAG: helix-turn-helix domain-containing protein [Zoogloeaceae bacterium]|jgi:phage repressor protein C with HTH and peptisase S24 domain|nr:helix-turn-helix domain-containing protein [Zoogloeaceae bacterium]